MSDYSNIPEDVLQGASALFAIATASQDTQAAQDASDAQQASGDEQGDTNEEVDAAKKAKKAKKNKAKKAKRKAKKRAASAAEEAQSASESREASADPTAGRSNAGAPLTGLEILAEAAEIRRYQEEYNAVLAGLGSAGGPAGEQTQVRRSTRSAAAAGRATMRQSMGGDDDDDEEEEEHDEAYYARKAAIREGKKVQTAEASDVTGVDTTGRGWDPHSPGRVRAQEEMYAQRLGRATEEWPTSNARAEPLPRASSSQQVPAVGEQWPTSDVRGEPLPTGLASLLAPSAGQQQPTSHVGEEAGPADPTKARPTARMVQLRERVDRPSLSAQAKERRFKKYLASLLEEVNRANAAEEEAEEEAEEAAQEEAN